jgi:hypothetical protein
VCARVCVGVSTCSWQLKCGYALCACLCACVRACERALDMHTHSEGLIAGAGASRGSGSGTREAEASRDGGGAGSEGGSDCARTSETVG